MSADAPYISARELAQFDLTRLLTRGEEERSAFLQPVLERAEARVNRYEPITPQDRFHAFDLLGYRPHGLFLPNDSEGQEELKERLWTIGEILDPDVRNVAYIRLQHDTEQWELQGVEGHWIGQQGITRSHARHRLVEWGRRGGKTFHAAREGTGIALLRPRSVIWIAAPTNSLVARCFDMVVEILADLRIKPTTKRDTKDEKLVILPNGSRLEGVSLEQFSHAAGAAVDLCIVDEAAQIDEEQFVRAILPPLADKNGQVLLISSPEGDGTFLHKRAHQALKEHDPDWDVFIDASYDVNFYMFPQGRRTQTIVQAEKEMSAEDFLEQFAGIAAGARNRIFPQFRDDVHVEPCPYVPGVPVTLAIDPSGGAVPYAVEAIQTIDGLHRVFDEYYVEGALAEQAMQWVETKAWRPDVTLVIMDSASLSEVIRWQQGGFPAFGVPNKPQPYERYPYYRKLLRDPRAFYPFQMRLRAEAMVAQGIDPDEYEELPLQEQGRITLEIEEKLSLMKISAADIDELRACRRLVFDPRCRNVIEEHATYAYRKPRIANTDLTEQPRKYKDHGLDALGYWAWYIRFDDAPMPLSTNVLKPTGGYTVQQPDGVEEGQVYFPSFLEQMRATFSYRPNFSYLGEG